MLETTQRGAGWLLAILFASLQWLALLVVRGVLILVGLPAVALAIPFSVIGHSVSDGRLIENLPRWAWLFGNDYDGLQGDKRGWWDDNCDAAVLFGLLPLLRRLGVPLDPLTKTDWLARWWWAAVRNPVNNLRLVAGFNCPVSECVIRFLGGSVVEDKPGYSGWQFVAGGTLAAVPGGTASISSTNGTRPAPSCCAWATRSSPNTRAATSPARG